MFEIYAITTIIIGFGIHSSCPEKMKMWYVFFSPIIVPLIIGVVLGEQIKDSNSVKED